ncbi:hypothetical protein BGZ96_005601 [Linnemannia gamsii]|uniref:Mediator of RNA polymerase II transcription subunit 9 n=1 Tax=Linnemannia gamsii TaxID=64522 RepID=A0ABQ7K5I8_9FUNG|nr:hypothetical protein BGZ96_005601 [Linnemannia gamsii]
MANTVTTSSVPLPSLSDIIHDLVTLRSASISLSQPTTNTLNHALGIPEEPASSSSSSVSSSQEKLEKLRTSTEKSQREEGVVENGFEVATDFLKMQQQISVSKQEMNTLHERLDGLEKELTEVRELIAFNPIK